MNALSSRNLARLQLAYEQTGIVFYVWDAFRFCRANGLPIPTWVLRYLDRSAEKILNLAKSNKGRRFPQQARQIGIALGFSGRRGRPNLFEQMKRRERIEKIVREVEDAITKRNKLYLAYEDVGHLNKTSPATVRRLYLAWRKERPA
jgi:hypothetical protein